MIKYMILSLAVFSAALLLTGCSAEADGAYKKISASEAKEMMDKGNVTIVDVREPSEYAGGHVPGAMLLPLGTVSSSAEKALPDKGRCSFSVYCRSGVRSLKASRELVSMGYKHVNDFGGILDWPYEIEK